MIYTLNNINQFQAQYSIVKRQRVVGKNTKNDYRLLEPLTFKLSNGDVITIPLGFQWDLSSVPRIFWWLLPPDGDFEVASMIHDHLYINKKTLGHTRSFVDKEMLIWSKYVSGTNNKYSLRNIDNYTRYIFVRIFGWLVWYDIIKIK